MSDPIEQAAGAPRWGRVLYLPAWAALTIAQFWLLGQAMGSGDAAAAFGERLLAAAPQLAGVAALQVAKAGVAVRRLRDLGRPGDDAMLAFVPIFNIVLFFQLLAGAPTEDARRKRIRSWATQLTAAGAYRQAAGLLPKTAAVGVLGAVLATVLVGWVGDVVVDALVAIAGDERRGPAGQGAVIVFGALSLYVALQFGKRDRASRTSWIPALFWLPSGLLALGLTLTNLAEQGLGAVLLILFELSWMLSMGGIVGGAVAALWIVAGHRAERGDGAGAGATWSEAKTVLGGVMVAWTTRLQIVQIGMQVVIPGIWYAISFAFSDIVAALRPERAMLAGSTDLTRGIRGKIFKMLLFWAVVTTLLASVPTLVLLGGDTAVAAMFDPTLVPRHVIVLQDVGWWLTSWWTTLAMLVVFLERDALWLRKQAQDEEAKANQAAVPKQVKDPTGHAR